MTCKIINGDCIESMRCLDSESVNCCVTSPPYYGLRDYGVDGQIGLEETPELYVARLVDVFREVRRVLRDDGTVWLNLGDSYSGGKQGRDDADRGKRHTDGRNPESQSLWKTPEGKQRPVPVGLKPKDLIGIPWRVAFALQADGWYLRQDIIWHKPNPMPESVTDRCTKAHEYIFLLTKSARYWYDAEAIKEDSKSIWKATDMLSKSFGKNDSMALNNPDLYRTRGRNSFHSDNERTTTNRRSVWTIATKPYSAAHFATFPPRLIEPCIMAGCPVGGTVLDPFGGSGTTGEVAINHRRNAVLIEINSEYVPLINERIRQAEADAPLLLDYMETQP